MSDMNTRKERQLQLLIALDEARDALRDSHNPLGMFQAIVELLTHRFNADACAILVTEDTTEDMELTICVGVEEAVALPLCKIALEYAAPHPLPETPWQYSLGLSVILDNEQHVIGSILLARKETAFAEEDIQLLILAESQIDSAIVQARSIWRLAERNRELEAIYQIDRLRDEARDEAGLLNNFTGLLVEHFRAELCLLILSHIDTGELVTRGLVDKLALPPATLHAIAENTRSLERTDRLSSPVIQLSLLGAPLIVSGVRLGAVVVGRQRQFRHNDVRLMKAIIAQMDTAIAKSRTEQQLAQRTRELEAIYRIDHIRDQETDFDLMLQRVLTELCDAVNSETGYLILYNADKEQPLEIKASTRETVFTRTDYHDLVLTTSRQALDKGSVISHNYDAGAVRSIIATPLILNDTVIGVFGAINNRRSSSFNAEDERMLTAITSQVDTAVFERLERRRMRALLSRSVDPKVLERLLQRAHDSLLTGERVVISVLFADLRGSTEWAERTSPEELVSLLNTFLGMMTDVIFKHGGTLDKFVGDEVIALYGTPLSMERHAYFASKTALEMQVVHEKIRGELARQGREIPPMGIGIASGEVIAGEFGPPIRTDFTAMGRVMNLGSRLCSAAGGGKIVISEVTRNFLGDDARVLRLDPITPKGIAQPVNIFELLEIE